MDRLWTPWRYNYVSRAEPNHRKGVPTALDFWPEDQDKHCVFCNLIGSVEYAIRTGMDQKSAHRAAWIVHRGKFCFVCLNAYPYATGHMLLIPYEHLDSLAKLSEAAATEMMLLAQLAERVLRDAYHPEGLNFGMNLGEAAGAGVAAHLHLHALPRWTGDTNFMTVVAETRILPETMDITWEKLNSIFSDKASL